MPLRKKVRQIMIPLDKYAVIGPEATLHEAVSVLRRSYCQVETGLCTEMGPRKVLVVDTAGELMGILNFRSILRVLVPEAAGGLTEKLEALEVSVVFAEAGVDLPPDELKARIWRNAQVKVKDVMFKSRAHVEAEASILDALKLIFEKKVIVLPVYDKGQLIGLVRDADLFLAVADTIVN
jgi:Mg/Co/Ni transporter MgtE